MAGLYFKLGNAVYMPGHTILITDIEEQPPANRSDPGNTLICVTTNVNRSCCRGKDNPNGGAIGDFVGPKGVHITTLSNIGTATDVIYSVRYTHQLRLGRRGFPTGPLGKYECKVPIGIKNRTAFIILSSK